jgi:pyochelin biosynthetic protein PchC
MSSDLWIRRFHPSPQAAVRLVCFPHAGGSASFFHTLSKLLHPQVEVLAIQYPGRQDRRSEPLVPDIGELAERIAEALRPWDDRPSALFGHSMGAVVAFETARLLPKEPTALFASGRRAPTSVREDSLHLADDRTLVAELLRLDATAATLLEDEEMLAMILPALRNDYRAVERYRYRPGPPADFPITALIGDSDPRVTREEAHAWSGLTTAPFTLRAVPGGHFYLSTQWPRLATLLGDFLMPAAGGAIPGGPVRPR